MNVEKTRHAREILFRLKKGNDQENSFWSEKCVNLKRRDIKFLARAKKNHCLWFLSSSRLILSKNSLRVYVYERNQTRLKKTSLDSLSKNNFSGIKIERKQQWVFDVGPLVSNESATLRQIDRQLRVSVHDANGKWTKHNNRLNDAPVPIDRIVIWKVKF